MYPGDERFCSHDGEELSTVEVRDPLVGEVLGERFRVQERLSAGGMGRVYRAEQTSISRSVAIKVLHPGQAADATAIARFEREARAIAALRSPHTVRVHDFGPAASGEFFMVMELLEGQTLKRKLLEQGTLSVDETVRILAAVGRSLGEAHVEGIVHRDLTPANIFLAESHDYPEFVKVLDFGIASWMDETGPRLTRGSGVVGTPAYVAPERIGGAEASPASDIYALGVLAHECLTGRAPFVADTAEALFELQLRAEPPPLPESIQGALAALVMRCLAKAPQLRPRNGDAFVASLEAAASSAGQPLAVTGEASVPRTLVAEALRGHTEEVVSPSAPNRSRGLWGAAAALVVGVGLGFVLGRLPGEAPAQPGAATVPAARATPAVDTTDERPAPAPRAREVPAPIEAATSSVEAATPVPGATDTGDGEAARPKLAADESGAALPESGGAVGKARATMRRTAKKRAPKRSKPTLEKAPAASAEPKLPDDTRKKIDGFLK